MLMGFKNQLIAGRAHIVSMGIFMGNNGTSMILWMVAESRTSLATVRIPILYILG